MQSHVLGCWCCDSTTLRGYRKQSKQLGAEWRVPIANNLNLGKHVIYACSIQAAAQAFCSTTQNHSIFATRAPSTQTKCIPSLPPVLKPFGCDMNPNARPVPLTASTEKRPKRKKIVAAWLKIKIATVKNRTRVYRSCSHFEACWTTTLPQKVWCDGKYLW